MSSSLKIHGKPAIGYDRYDSDNQIEVHRVRSPGLVGTTSFLPEAEKLSLSSTARIGRSPSPFRIGHARTSSPSVDEFVMDDSSGRIVERASPSHPRFDYRRVQLTDDTNQQFETSAYSSSTGVELQRPRALIDAYGMDQGKRTFNNKTPKVENVDINGINSKAAMPTWQNTEEEEFDWEDMSPTLGNRSVTSDVSFRMGPGFGTHHHPPSENDFRRGNWSNQSQHSVGNGSPVVPEDAVPSINVWFILLNYLPSYMCSMHCYFIIMDLNEKNLHARMLCR